MDIVVTGSSGLIGSEAVEYFARAGHRIHGIDNNMRADFFGPQGDTTWRQKQLLGKVKGFAHHALDIRHRAEVLEFFSQRRIGAVIHCAAQPSHDLAKDRPFDDFDINAGGTLNLL
jgi:CDP-paratose 2-epimerase